VVATQIEVVIVRIARCEVDAELKYTIFDGKPGKKIGEGCLIRLAK
jgi:hypothetical protein